MKRILQIALLLGCGYAWGAEVQIAGDRMAVLNGNRTFVLGLYENPKEDSALDQVAAAGFNLVQSDGTAEALDRLGKRGLYSWVNTGATIDLSDDTENRTAALRALVTGVAAKHPALFCWEVPDEALWNVWYGAELWRLAEQKQHRELIAALTDEAARKEVQSLRDEADKLFANAYYKESEDKALAVWEKLGKTSPNPELRISNAPVRAAKMRDGMLAGYRLMKELDPIHPVWMNHAPRNQIEQLAAFNEAADAVGCDIYPINEFKGGHSDLVDRSMTSVGAFTRRMQAAAPGKPVWMVLQGFGWHDIGNDKEDTTLRRPNLSELRFMCFDTIVHGARGILFWGTAFIEKDSQLWSDVMTTIRELADLQPVLSAPDATLTPAVTYDQTWGSLEKGVFVLPKDVDGKLHLIVVNEELIPLRLHIGNLPGGVTSFTNTMTGEPVAVEHGIATLHLPRRGIALLRQG